MFLDCTRLDGKKNLVSRRTPNDLESVSRQTKEISSLLKSIGESNIVLADDVVFSGSVLKTIIELFRLNNIEVVGISTCIAKEEAYNYFAYTLKEGIKTGYLMTEDVIDQICERDFYFGIAGSGISVLTNAEVVKAPYFLPFGNPIDRASIPKYYEEYFSKSCINRSIALWNEIERLSKRKILIKDLPEKIQNTSPNEEVIKVLKKGIN